MRITLIYRSILFTFFMRKIDVLRYWGSLCPDCRVHIRNGHFDGCTKRNTISWEMFDIGNQWAVFRQEVYTAAFPCQPFTWPCDAAIWKGLAGNWSHLCIDYKGEHVVWWKVFTELHRKSFFYVRLVPFGQDWIFMRSYTFECKWLSILNSLIFGMNILNSF